MIFGIISDVHSNLQALEAVFEDLEGKGVEECVCLGDIVGYGPNPNECVDLIREKCSITVKGNHDEVDNEDLVNDKFNESAKKGFFWTQENLTQENKDWLNALPYHFKKYGCLLVHANPMNPKGWKYVTDLAIAEDCFDYFDESVCFLGHTHVPFIVKNEDGETHLMQEKEFQIEYDEKLLVNVGSVGQPRDKNPKASYAIFDSKKQKLTLHRVEYDFKKTQSIMLELGLESRNIERLEKGR